MWVRVGINGMGRIGRAVLRGIIERSDTPVEVVAVNDVAPLSTLAHLLRYDSTYGPWAATIETDKEHLSVDGHLVRVFHHAQPEDLDWADVGADVVIEATVADVVPRRPHGAACRARNRGPHQPGVRHRHRHRRQAEGHLAVVTPLVVVPAEDLREIVGDGGDAAVHQAPVSGGRANPRSGTDPKEQR